jgi:hypothetical protein
MRHIVSPLSYLFLLKFILLAIFGYYIRHIMRSSLKEARYSYLKNREQNWVTIFTRRSPPRMFYSVLCKLLTSLQFSILENNALYLSILSGNLCSNFACCIALLKTFIVQKIKKSVMPKTFSHFPKMALQNFFILRYLLAFCPSKIMHEKKLGVTMLLFQLYETIGHFGVISYTYVVIATNYLLLKLI